MVLPTQSGPAQLGLAYKSPGLDVLQRIFTIICPDLTISDLVRFSVFMAVISSCPPIQAGAVRPEVSLCNGKLIGDLFASYPLMPWICFQERGGETSEKLIVNVLPEPILVKAHSCRHRALDAGVVLLIAIGKVNQQLLLDSLRGHTMKERKAMAFSGGSHFLISSCSEITWHFEDVSAPS